MMKDDQMRTTSHNRYSNATNACGTITAMHAATVNKRVSYE